MSILWVAKRCIDSPSVEFNDDNVPIFPKSMDGFFEHHDTRSTWRWHGDGEFKIDTDQEIDLGFGLSRLSCMFRLLKSNEPILNLPDISTHEWRHASLTISDEEMFTLLKFIPWNYLASFVRIVSLHLKGHHAYQIVRKLLLYLPIFLPACLPL